MKIRHPVLIRALAFAIAWIVRLWIGTLRYRYRPLGPNVDPHQPGLQDRYIYALWHENMLLMACRYAHVNAHLLISQHADGQLFAEVCRHFGLGTVRGSTTRGGAEAVRQLLRQGRKTHLAITPDGPRGPRRKVQQGLVYVAARTGLPIVAVGIGFGAAWRMASWDRFALPKPFSAAVCVTDELIEVPQDADRATMDEFTERVEKAMQRVNDLAERWAATGRWVGEDSRVAKAGLTSVNGRG